MLKASFFELIGRIWQISCLLFWMGLWIFGLGLLAWYPLRWWPGDRFLAVRLVNYLMPWLLVGLIPGLLAAGLARRKWLLLTLAVPTILISLLYAPLFLPRPRPTLAGSPSLKVMSYNKWVHNPDIAATAGVIRREQPDILLLQEVKLGVMKILKDDLRDLYPEDKLHVAYEPRIGQAVVSRYPLVPLESQIGRAQRVLVQTDRGPITVWNVHSSMPLFWSQHHQEISTLAEDMAEVDGPLIIGGDFNTTDQSEAYRLLDRQLHNAHWQAGWGFGFTFPSSSRQVRDAVSLPRLVRIDHIFFSDHFYAVEARTLPESGGSDHLPVVAELVRTR